MGFLMSEEEKKILLLRARFLIDKPEEDIVLGFLKLKLRLKANRKLISLSNCNA